MAAPRVISEGVASITHEQATFVGMCTSLGGLATVAWFEIQAGPGLWGIVSDSVDVPEARVPFAVDAPVGTTYFTNNFRAVAANADGIDYGAWIRFWVPAKGKEAEGSPFYITQREITWIERQFTLYLWSDVPAHLWAHISYEAPWKKRGFHFKRGRIFHHSPKIYWGYRWSIEQEEDGDVVLHTFIFECPPQWDTYWVQAMGNIDGKHSPSRSPFFRYSVLKEVYSLGIYSEDPPLEDHVSLAEGAGIVLTYNAETNTIIISDPNGNPRRIRRHGYGHGRGPRNPGSPPRPRGPR